MGLDFLTPCWTATSTVVDLEDRTKPRDLLLDRLQREPLTYEAGLLPTNRTLDFRPGMARRHRQQRR